MPMRMSPCLAMRILAEATRGEPPAILLREKRGYPIVCRLNGTAQPAVPLCLSFVHSRPGPPFARLDPGRALHSDKDHGKNRLPADPRADGQTDPLPEGGGRGRPGGHRRDSERVRIREGPLRPAHRGGYRGGEAGDEEDL